MILKLEKNNQTNLHYDFFINVLRKDMELTLWKMKVSKLFGDFEIFSQKVNEMDSFDHIVEFYFNEKTNFDTKNLASEIISRCFEHFYAYVYHTAKKPRKFNNQSLPQIFLDFILEAVELKNLNYEDALIELKALEKIYFEYEDSMTDYLRSDYLN